MNRSTRGAMTSLLIGAVTTFAVASEVESKYEKTVPASGVSSVEITNPGGDVEVLPTTGTQVEIQAVCKVTGASEEYCTDLANRFTVSVKRSMGALKVGHNQPFDHDYTTRVNYTISVPEQLKLRITSTNGNIACRERSGEINCRSETGDIELQGCDGKLNCVTQQGGIIVETASQEANFETTEGNIEVYLTHHDGGRIRTKSINGSVRLSLPDGASTMISARTTRGRISGGVYEQALLINGSQTYASGRIGSGDGSVIIETGSGGIEFSHYAPPVAEVAEPPQTVIVNRTTPVYVERHHYSGFGACYPRYRHFHRPWQSRSVIRITPFRIELGGGHHRGHDRDWDRDWDDRHRRGRHHRR